METRLQKYVNSLESSYIGDLTRLLDSLDEARMGTKKASQKKFTDAFYECLFHYFPLCSGANLITDAISERIVHIIDTDVRLLQDRRKQQNAVCRMAIAATIDPTVLCHLSTTQLRLIVDTARRLSQTEHSILSVLSMLLLIDVIEASHHVTLAWGEDSGLTEKKLCEAFCQRLLSGCITEEIIFNAMCDLSGAKIVAFVQPYLIALFYYLRISDVACQYLLQHTGIYEAVIGAASRTPGVNSGYCAGMTLLWSAIHSLTDYLYRKDRMADIRRHEARIYTTAAGALVINFDHGRVLAAETLARLLQVATGTLQQVTEDSLMSIVLGEQIVLKRLQGLREEQVAELVLCPLVPFASFEFATPTTPGEENPPPLLFSHSETLCQRSLDLLLNHEELGVMRATSRVLSVLANNSLPLERLLFLAAGESGMQRVSTAALDLLARVTGTGAEGELRAVSPRLFSFVTGRFTEFLDSVEGGAHACTVCANVARYVEARAVDEFVRSLGTQGLGRLLSQPDRRAAICLLKSLVEAGRESTRLAVLRAFAEGDLSSISSSFDGATQLIWVALLSALAEGVGGERKRALRDSVGSLFLFDNEEVILREIEYLRRLTDTNAEQVAHMVSLLNAERVDHVISTANSAVFVSLVQLLTEMADQSYSSATATIARHAASALDNTVIEEGECTVALMSLVATVLRCFGEDGATVDRRFIPPLKWAVLAMRKAAERACRCAAELSPDGAVIGALCAGHSILCTLAEGFLDDPDCASVLELVPHNELQRFSDDYRHVDPDIAESMREVLRALDQSGSEEPQDF